MGDVLFDVSPLILAAAIGLLLSVFLARIRQVPGTRSLLGLVVAASLWSAGYALEFLAPDMGAKVFWAKFQYFGIIGIPLAWLLFAYRYLESHEWPRELRVRALLAIIPVLTLILVWTNELHHLIWRSIELVTTGPIPILEFDHGPWFWVYWVFAYVLLLLGSFRLAKTLLGSVRLYNWQISLALFAVVIPWLANLFYVTGLSPVHYLDLTPFAFVVAGAFMTVALFRYQLANIPPIAHQQVFEGQADRLIVLDAQGFVADLNSAARGLVDPSAEDPIGKPLAKVIPELASWIEKAPIGEEFHAEIALGEAAAAHIYDFQISPLGGGSQTAIGRLIELHEITQLKRVQARLEQVVSQRTEELRHTVGQLEVELAQRTLAEKRFEEVIESAPDAMLVVDRGGAIRLVNVQTERLFGYSKAELLGQPVENLMPGYRRQTHGIYTSEFFSNPSVRLIGSTSLNYTALRKDGSEFPVELSLGPLNTADGIWAACSIRDMTERTKAEEEQSRLLEQIKQSREELRLLAIRLQEVQEIERRQIAGELHDRIGQNLTGLNLNLQILENQLDAASNAAAVDRLKDSLKLVEETTRQVRDVMADLHPPALDEYGLLAALRWYSGVFAQRTGIAARVTGTEFEPRLSPNVELVLFRIVQEALNNVAKHARSTEVEVEVDSFDQTVSVTVQDNGTGFELQVLQSASNQTHWGLINMRQRAASIGGQLTVDSDPGQGTRVRVDVRRLRDGN